MAKVDALLGVLGLTTRQHLDKAIAKKKQWHGLVRDVFAQYYLKFRESSLDNLPELPARYSADWEEFMKKEVDAFLKLDLESVGELLETCGFGTEKWDQIKEAGFPAFRKLVEDYLDESDQVGGNGHAAMTDIADAAGEDVRLLLADHPDVIDEITSRFNPETGLFRPSEEEITTSSLYVDLENEVKKLRKGGLRALDQISEFETQIENLQAQLMDGGGAGTAAAPDIGFDDDEEDREEIEPDVGDDLDDDEIGGMDPATAALFDREAVVQELTEEVDRLKNEIKARDHSIESLEEKLGQAGGPAGDLTDARKRITALEQQLDEEVSALNKELKTRDYKIEQLQEELEGSQTTPAPTVVESGRSSGDEELAAENTRLQSDLRASEQTVKTLRHQVAKFEEDLGKVRDQLVEQVERLAAITTGEVDIKPSNELEGMNSDQLLGYARDVAEDLDVRRQTLDEGIQGLDSVKDSFEENKRVYEEQELALQKQLHALRTSLDDRDRELKLAQQSGTEVTAEDARETIGAQRQQLELLSTRVKQLMSTNRELQDTSKKTYTDLEQAVRRLMPLRKQIEDLEHLRDALSAYIREKYDRSFSTRKLDEVLK